MSKVGKNEDKHYIAYFCEVGGYDMQGEPIPKGEPYAVSITAKNGGCARREAWAHEFRCRGIAYFTGTICRIG